MMDVLDELRANEDGSAFGQLCGRAANEIERLRKGRRPDPDDPPVIEPPAVYLPTTRIFPDGI